VYRTWQSTRPAIFEFCRSAAVVAKKRHRGEQKNSENKRSVAHIVFHRSRVHCIVLCCIAGLWFLPSLSHPFGPGAAPISGSNAKVNRIDS
jgi:hypothetical protein